MLLKMKQNKASKWQKQAKIFGEEVTEKMVEKINSLEQGIIATNSNFKKEIFS